MADVWVNENGKVACVKRNEGKRMKKIKWEKKIN